MNEVDVSVSVGDDVGEGEAPGDVVGVTFAGTGGEFSFGETGVSSAGGEFVVAFGVT